MYCGDCYIRRRGGDISGVETVAKFTTCCDVDKFYPRLDRKEFRLSLVKSVPVSIAGKSVTTGGYCGEHWKNVGLRYV